MSVSKRLVVAGALLGGIFGMSVLFGDTVAQAQRESPKGGGQTEVVMVRCTTNSSDFSVSAYRGSSGAPGKRGETCPEVLSQLLKDGFVVADVGHYDRDSDYVVFMLSRGR